MTFFSPIFPLTITCYPMSSCNECIVFLFIHFGFLILSLNLCLIVGFVSVGRRSKLHLPALRTFWKILPFPMFYNISFCLSFPLQGFYTVRDNNWFFLNLLKSLATIPLILSSTFSRWKKATLKNAGLGLFFFLSQKRGKRILVFWYLCQFWQFVHPFLQPITISSLMDVRIQYPLFWTSILSLSISRSMFKTYTKVPVNRFLKNV